MKKRSRSARVQSARFRYSRLKEAATPTLWPMGFESSSVYRSVNAQGLAECWCDRDSSISGHVFRSQPPSYRKTGGSAAARMWGRLDAAGLGPRTSASGNMWASSIQCRFTASTRSVRRSERLRSNGVVGSSSCLFALCFLTNPQGQSKVLRERRRIRKVAPRLVPPLPTSGWPISDRKAASRHMGAQTIAL